MSKLITKTGYENLCVKLSSLKAERLPSAIKLVEELRPIGIVSDNAQEFLAAKADKESIELKISDLTKTINDCVIFDKTNANFEIIGFGATVGIKNLINNSEKEYKIVSIYESDLNNNLISIEAPLSKEMIGLTIGDIFEFNDITYEVLSISY